MYLAECIDGVPLCSVLSRSPFCSPFASFAGVLAQCTLASECVCVSVDDDDSEI